MNTTLRIIFISILIFLANSLLAQNAELQKIEQDYQQKLMAKDYKAALPLIRYLAQATDQQADSTHIRYRSEWGNTLIKLNKLNEAETLLRASIEKAEQKNIRLSSVMEMNLKNRYGATLLGQYKKEAEPFYENLLSKAATLFEEENELYLKVLANTARVFKVQHRIDEAIKLQKKHLAILKKQNKTTDDSYIQALVDLSRSYKKIRKISQAEELVKEAMEILKFQRKMKGAVYIEVLGELAILRAMQGDVENADQLFEQSIELLKSIHNETHPYVLKQEFNRVGLNIRGKRLEFAAKLLKSIEMKLSVQPEKYTPYFVKIFEYQGIIYSDLGDFEAASLAFEQLMKVAAAHYGKENERYATKLYNYIHFVQKHFDPDSSNMPLILKALDAISPDIDSLTDWQANDFSLLASAKAYDEVTMNKILGLSVTDFNERYALTDDKMYLRKAFTISKIIQHRIYSSRKLVINQKDQLRLLTMNKSVLSSLLVLANKLNKLYPEENYLAQAFEAAERSKSILLGDALKAQQARSMGNLPDSLQAKEEALQKQQVQLQKQLLTEKDEQKLSLARSKYNTATQKLEEFQALLKEQYPTYYSQKYENEKVDIAAIQKALGSQTAILEYSIQQGYFYVFYLDKSSIELLKLKVEQEAFDKHVANLRKALSDYSFIREEPEKAWELYTTTAYWFYKEFLMPVLNDKPALERLNIVTSGTLGHLPFEAFLTEPAPPGAANYKELAYLLNRYIISYNYNASLWLANRQRPAGKVSKRLLAMAASYAKNNESTSLSRSADLRSLRDALQDLPAAKAEVEALEKAYSGTFLYGETANEKAFKSMAKDYQVIHLAMHGLLNKKHPILSSLAFTENGDSIEDNFLQAYEISNLNLQADLVVLSACETGYGKFEHGEGVMSLARSFMYAGVPALVVSLWQVNDASTAIIMKNYYHQLQQGKDKAEALQIAKQNYLQTVEGVAAHPAFWAPFIQLGDSTPLELSQGWSWWLLVLIVLAAVGLAVWWMRRKRR